jgi:drug/metabolite transporter (DMT)-like permease
MPRGSFLGIAALFLLALAGALVSFFAADDTVARSTGLVTTAVVAVGAVSFCAMQFSRRRRRRERSRAELLRSVATDIAALERRRRGESVGEASR